jgi:hypothetical protein
VLDVTEVGEDANVFVRHIVAIRVAHHREVRSIRHPEILPMPGEALDAVEACGKGPRFIRDAIAVGVLKNDHAVRW